jgi:hypothetical protein
VKTAKRKGDLPKSGKKKPDFWRIKNPKHLKQLIALNPTMKMLI